MLVSVIGLGDVVVVDPDIVRISIIDISYDPIFAALDFKFPTMNVKTELAKDGFFNITDTIRIKLIHCKKEKIVMGLDAPKEVKIHVERKAKSEQGAKPSKAKKLGG